MTKKQAYELMVAARAQGARCGHCEGRGRAGSYVAGEEWDLAREATRVNAPETYHTPWFAGYVEGYQLAAQGEPLPSHYAEAGLPDWSLVGWSPSA